MGKYETLGKYLHEKKQEKIVLNFSEIETILGFPLPKSSKKYRPWWANDETHSQAVDGWMNHGFQTKQVDIEEETITFLKTGNRTMHVDPLKGSFYPTLTPQQFETRAREKMSEYLGVALTPGKKEEWPKLFDYVSDDYLTVGDAKYLSMVRGKYLPPAKLSVISEHVWMLEKVDSTRKFLVFGNDRRVPEEWLKRYGFLNDDVEFYFISRTGKIIKLR